MSGGGEAWYCGCTPMNSNEFIWGWADRQLWLSNECSLSRLNEVDVGAARGDEALIEEGQCGLQQAEGPEGARPG